MGLLGALSNYIDSLRRGHVLFKTLLVNSARTSVLHFALLILGAFSFLSKLCC